MSEVRKVKNVRPLTCEMSVELPLQNGTRMLLMVGSQIYERTRNECASDVTRIRYAYSAGIGLLILAAVRLPLSLQTSGHDAGRASLKLESV